MRTPIAFALLAFAAPGLAEPPAARTATASAATSVLRAEGAWVRRNPVPGRPSAGYVTIKGGSSADVLTGATAPGVRIELHSMSMAGGVMQMAKLNSAALPAGGSIAFAPGGNHLMIYDLPAGAKSLPITFRFASGKTATATAEIKAADTDMHAGH